MKVSAVLRAIRKQARRIKNGRSHFSVDQHVDAIIALANIGSDVIRQANEKKGLKPLAVMLS